MKAHFDMFAGYNRWANRRLYAAARTLPMPITALLAAPSSARSTAPSTISSSLTASGCAASPARVRSRTKLDEVLFEDLAALTAAREVEDERIVRYVEGLSEVDLASTFT